MWNNNLQFGEGLAYVHSLTVVLMNGLCVIGKIGRKTYRHPAASHGSELRGIHAGGHWYPHGHVVIHVGHAHIPVCRRLAGHEGLSGLLLLMEGSELPLLLHLLLLHRRARDCYNREYSL
jgi:hypothetical protein